ncbi:response regulator transcription factor [Paenibacillus sp. MBLB4367]|uniref:response regulator transcription factor n=1 Tax=Paenibacillus sp. MBLB4367 TaxID=3384767 RepID=UPI0039083989
MKVLVVEDDKWLLHAISTVFAEESYQVDTADNGDDGLHLAEQGLYDLIVLDIMLPGASGIWIVRELRYKQIKTPVLLLTAKDSVEDRVKGLDAGADDYLIKPFAVPELLARARALLRRNEVTAGDGDLYCGQLTLKPKLQDGFIRDMPLRLTAKEYELLEYLVINREQIVTREQMFDRVWGFDSEAASGAVDLYVHYVRKKMAPHGIESLIQTVRGVGYMMKGK